MKLSLNAILLGALTVMRTNLFCHFSPSYQNLGWFLNILEYWTLERNFQSLRKKWSISTKYKGNWGPTNNAKTFSGTINPKSSIRALVWAVLVAKCVLSTLPSVQLVTVRWTTLLPCAHCSNRYGNGQTLSVIIRSRLLDCERLWWKRVVLNLHEKESIQNGAQ